MPLMTTELPKVLKSAPTRKSEPLRLIEVPPGARVGLGTFIHPIVDPIPEALNVVAGVLNPLIFTLKN